MMPTRSDLFRRLLVSLALVGALLPQMLSAQGYGPRAFAPVPKDLTILTPFAMFMDGNMEFDSSIVFPGLEIESNVGILQVSRSFDLFGHIAGAFVVLPAGEVNLALAGTGAEGDSSGLADPAVGFTVALYGTPAMTMQEFAQWQPTSTMGLMIVAQAPLGEYDPNKAANIGADRWKWIVGFPWTAYLRGGPGRPTSTFELLPSVSLFGDVDATGDGQDPLYGLEAHLTHDLRPQLWGSIDALYVTGGETDVNGVDQNNSQRSTALGATLGWKFKKGWGVEASYGETVSHNEFGSDGRLIRVKASLPIVPKSQRGQQ